MKRILLLASILCAGCTDASKAPEIKDIENITINDKSYTAIQYVREFCQFPEADKDTNCFKASKQANKDMSKLRNIEW
jgi:hypothetical protein